MNHNDISQSACFGSRQLKAIPAENDQSFLQLGGHGSEIGLAAIPMNFLQQISS